MAGVGDATSATYTIDNGAPIPVIPVNGQITIPIPETVGSYLVAVSATDAAGNSGTKTFTVEVKGTIQLPIAAFSATPNTGSAPLTVNFMDASKNATNYDWNFGDNTINSTDKNPTHVYSIAGSYSVTLTVKNEKGFSNSLRKLNYITVTTVNSPPVITAIGFPAEPYQKGSTVSVTGSFTDPDTTDTHTAQFAWGDGTTSAGIVTKSGITGSVTGSHLFNTVGIYTVNLTVTDSKGASTTASSTDFVVIYDPEGQFVTGGGGFNSVAGLYLPDPTLTGKASYGFNAKYKKGTMIPDGNTEFKIKEKKGEKVKFKATSYDWLVISGAKATFRGSGTIDKEGNYGFLISCIDGKLAGTDDKIRVSIWNKATNAVIYDNQPGAGINDAPTMTTEEGNIKIHK